MFRCVPVSPAMQPEWDRLALSYGTIFHTWAFRQVLLNSFNYQCGYHAVLDREDHLCALIPLILGRNLTLQQVGVAVPFVNHLDICAINDEARQYALEALQELKEQYGLSYVELRCRGTIIPQSGWQAQLQHVTFVLPLTGTEDQILALSTSGNRNHVRKAYKNDCFTASFDTCHLEAFYQVYRRRMKQLGSPAPAIGFFQRFFELLPDYTRLLTVLERERRQVVGGMLLLTSPGDATLYYPYGANLIEYNQKYLNNFMYWEAVKYGIRQGMQRLDIGRSQVGSGTYRYKEQWGAMPEQLTYLTYTGGKTAVGLPDKGKLQLFINLWKAAPQVVTDKIGSWLIPYVMP